MRFVLAFSRLPILVALASISVESNLASAEPSTRADILLADFEAPDYYSNWQSTGDAFGNSPAKGTLPGQQPVTGFEGKALVNSFFNGDKSTGTLTSPEFTIDRKFVNLKVGGGRHPGETCVNLLVEGNVARTETGTATTGADDEHLSWRSWDVSDLAGKRARIQIIDRSTDAWGHINVDHIVLSDQPRQTQFSNDSITRAMASVAGASPRAHSDPARPAFHLMPPALWCNDPNGPIFTGGWWHVFYQHNPYGDRWEHMHWGHARSPDLVHWEHLPIALWPSVEKGENHVFSGSAAKTPDGKVVLFYTSIGNRAPEQWAAVSDDADLLTWSKHPANPILTEKLHGDLKIDDWRDPFVFDAAGKKWLVTGGHPKGGKGGICLYKSISPDLSQWNFRGVAFQGTEPNWECPNLFQVGNAWLLLYSPHSQVRYYTGSLDLDPAKFTPSHHGTVDFGGDFYATSAAKDDRGRWILWGWIRGFPAGKGWNGCISLPREISIAKDGRLIQKPAAELARLRTGEPTELHDIVLNNASRVLSGDFGNQLEIEAEIVLDSAKRSGVKVLRSPDGKDTTTIFFDKHGLEVAGVRAPLQVRGNEPIHLHIYLDRSVLEVFAGEDVCLTKVVANNPSNTGLELFASGGRAQFHSVRLWKLGTRE